MRDDDVHPAGGKLWQFKKGKWVDVTAQFRRTDKYSIWLPDAVFQKMKDQYLLVYQDDTWSRFCGCNGRGGRGTHGVQCSQCHMMVESWMKMPKTKRARLLKEATERKAQETAA